MPRQSSLAKLTQPRLFGVAGRVRLHAQLDKERASHPVVWIVGPPGAGKTTLVTSYLDARELPVIWYQVDSGDSDLATFFYYMGLAGRAAAKRKRLILPLLTPEYLSDLPGFTRRFFRNLFSTVSEPPILVLDNYQEVIPSSVFHTVIDVVISELPLGYSLIAISRTDPPPQLARALANNLIGQINWNDLRLTLEETKAIVAATGLLESTEETLTLLQEQTNGWIAGLVLMIERFKETGAINHTYQSETMGTVFNYFTGQVFEQLSEEMREFLMRTAILSHMTIRTAAEMGKSPKAREWLNYLYRRKLFTDRRIGDDEISYQYHALFREFLLDRASIHFTLAELKEIRQLGACLAEQSGEIMAAAGLLAKAEEWQVLTEMINRQASSLLNQGRHQTLQEAIALLPEEIVNQEPWLLYWRAVSRGNFDPRSAIIDFEQAYIGFQALNNDKGLFFTVSAVINAYFFRSASMTPVLSWAKKLQELTARNNGFPSVEVEATVYASLMGLVFAAPHHSLFMNSEERIDRLIQSNIEPSLRVAISSTFLWLLIWQGNFRRTSHIISETNSILKHHYVPPMVAILWKVAEGTSAWCTACHQLATDIFSEGLQISQRAGLPLLDCMLWGVNAHNALSAGDVGAAGICLNESESRANQQNKLQIAELRILRSSVQFLQGDFRNAYITAKEALWLEEEIGTPFGISLARLRLAEIMIEVGDLEDAHDHLSNVIQYAHILKSDLLEHQALLIKAFLWRKNNNEVEALLPLQQGLSIAADNDYLVLNFCWRPHVMAKLFSLALQHGIEVDYVKSVIRRRHVRAESHECDHWPWPIKIYTLGKFEIHLDDVPLRFQGKTQHKPLELLKYLCASGGKSVNQDRIIDALWPDSMGDAGEQALRTTLHRLRKLLRHEQVIILEDKHLSLDFGYVWTDCGAFSHIAHHQKVTNNRISLQQALNYYRGHFLESDTSPWAITFRNQLRAHYTRIIEQYATFLEQEGDWPDAIECYLRAIEIEPLAEVFYNNLMNIYIKLDRHSDALLVYQRCRQSLLTRLGVNPSPHIQATYRKIIKTQ